jgi:hypothetical protein
MRRVLAISLALLVVMIAARGVAAQEDTVSDRLLEILKDRQIISPDEYGELKDLAGKMQEDQAEVDRRLTDLDRSIADYLAQGGDAMGANVGYMKGKGFGFMTGDGLFALHVGGMFQFSAVVMDNDNDRDTNSFDIAENRIMFQGHAFDPNLTYYFEYCADGAVDLLDAYLDWRVCDATNIRFGQFKVPYGRQNLVHASDRQFMQRNPVAANFNMDRDIGVALHDNMDMQDGMVFEYNLVALNGEGRNANGNENDWLEWGGRVGFYPMGFIPYVEGDWNGKEELKFGIAGSYFQHVTKPSIGTKSTAWELDAVMTWAGLYLTGEYFVARENWDGGGGIRETGWYAQAGYMIPDSQFEVVGFYGQANYDKYWGWDEGEGWAIGINYFTAGQHLKCGAYIGQWDLDEVCGNLDTTALELIFQLEW